MNGKNVSCGRVCKGIGNQVLEAYLPTYLTYIPTLPTYLPTYLSYIPTLPTYIHTYLTYIHTYLPTLPTYIPTLPAYLGSGQRVKYDMTSGKLCLKYIDKVLPKPERSVGSNFKGIGNLAFEGSSSYLGSGYDMISGKDQ